MAQLDDIGSGVMSGAAKDGKPVAGDLPDGVQELLIIRELERFVTTELELLDNREFEAWRDLFTEDGYYWAPSRIEQENPDDEVSLFFDDRKIMDIRFQRLRHPRVHAQLPHSRTTHVVGNFSLERLDESAGDIEFTCRFVMHEFRPEMDQRAFSGKYEYHIIRNGPEFQIHSKKVILINCDDFHFPISIPF